MKVEWLTTQIRLLFATLIDGIYSLISLVMQGIFDVSSLNPSLGLINEVRARIYVFLGIFMFFKLTISLLNYIVNPDAMTDKEKGIGKLVGRTVTMLVLLMLLPLFFGFIPRIQKEMLIMLPRVVLGQQVDNSATVNNSADYMATTALSAFFEPNPNCTDGSVKPITSLDEFKNNYKESKCVNGEYDYNFNYWGLAVGIILLVILVNMTIKIAIRFFKMFILEIIAPIPVMSYIDPKSAKDGAFASWVKQFISTFLDLFLRLGIIYIVLFFITKISDPNAPLFDLSHLPTGRASLVKVFLIIGLLMFAKDAPNFIKDAFGIKHDKDTSGMLAGITGAALGVGTGAISGAISGRGIRGAITGAATGANAGMESGRTGKKISSWQSAGDAAKQSRLGNPKAKSGIFNEIGRITSEHQSAASAKKLGITGKNLEDAKNNMIFTQSEASDAQRRYEFGVQNKDGAGHPIFYKKDGSRYTDDWHTNDDGTRVWWTARQHADEEVAKTGASATKAQKNYEKGNKAGDAYGINPSFAGDLKKEKKKDRAKYKAHQMGKEEYKDKGRFNPNKR